MKCSFSLFSFLDLEEENLQHFLQLHWTVNDEQYPWAKKVPFSRREKSPTPWNTLLYSWPLHDMMGLGYGCTLGRASVLHMKVMKTVRWSTITVPPPENLLTTGTLSCKTGPISRSSAGFLWKWLMLLYKITQSKTYSSKVLSLQLWHSSTHNFLHQLKTERSEFAHQKCR